MMAGSKSSAAKPQRVSAPVDMAIEWLPSSKPPIQIRRIDGSVSQADSALSSPLKGSGGTANGAPSPPSNSVHGPQTWSLSTEDRRLSIALQRWSALAGWQMVWEAERDFPIEVNVQIHGDFSTALEKLMLSLAESDYPLQGVVNAQTRVLRVRRQHESSR